jgi:membrane associated rhomboid family serine protease
MLGGLWTRQTYTRHVISLIPISDANPTRRFPIVTLALIALNVLAFIQTPGLGMSEQSTAYFVENAPAPCQLEDECPRRPLQVGPSTVVEIPDRSFTSFLTATVFATFLHAGFLHIAGNMLFLWVFGNNIEDFLGPIKFIAFYLLGGIAASFAHVFTHLDSFIPAVGASGAVAGVMGAYLILYPRARVNVLVPIFIIFTIVQLSAWIVLGLWFVYQFLIGAQELAGAGGVAWMAHVGGFVFGVIAIFLLGGRPQQPRVRWEPSWRY